jgi:upstream activation factor subunit UAF30
MDTYIESLSEKLTHAMEMFKQINVDFRLLQKQYQREKKNLGKKVKNKGGAGAGIGGKISGFAKPGFISSELCDFLKVDHDTQLARTDVTKKITQYIKENNLQDPLNKRRLLLDKSLTTLLKPS